MTHVRKKTIKIENRAAGFTEALRNGFRYEVIKNMTMRRIILTVVEKLYGEWKTKLLRTLPEYAYK